MDEDFIQGSKSQKLDYGQVVFRALDRIGYLSANFHSGEAKLSEQSRKYNEENFKLANQFLESLIVWQLKPEPHAEYFRDKQKIKRDYYSTDGVIKGAGDLDNRQWFDLICKYLPQTNIMPARRKMIETIEE